MDNHRNELSDTLDALAEIEQGQGQDHAEESLRERRLEELRKDKVECLCGQWFPLAEGKVCDLCYGSYCAACIGPATHPVTGEKLPFVCASCREEIKGIAEARTLLSHKDEIAEAVEDARRQLESLGDKPTTEWPGILGYVHGRLRTMQVMYGIRKVG